MPFNLIRYFKIVLRLNRVFCNFDYVHIQFEISCLNTCSQLFFHPTFVNPTLKALLHKEPVLYFQRLVRVHKFKIKAFYQHRDQFGNLQQTDILADARTTTQTERHIIVVHHRQLLRRCIKPTLRLELICINTVNVLIAVSDPGINANISLANS